MRSRDSRALLLTLLLASVACHRRHRSRSRSRGPAPSAVRLFVAPFDGPALLLGDSRALVGSLRIVGDRPAPAPWTSSPLVSAARLDGDAWLFASADGTLYRAARFDAPLSVLGSLEGRAASPRTDGIHTWFDGRSDGALVALDEHRDAWRVDASGALQKLPLSRVVSAIGVSSEVILAVVEPGAILVSRDGGARFEALSLAAGAARSVTRDARGVIVRTTTAELAWRDGRLDAITDAAPDEHLLEERARLARGRAFEAWPPLPVNADWAVEAPRGAVSVLRDSALVTLDPRDASERSRVEMPGNACSIARYAGGVGAVCTHDGWAVAAYALRDGSQGWETLRDAARAEPMGESVFDATSRAWITAAPCAQRSTPYSMLLCVTRADGTSVERSLPFDPRLIAAYGGVALAIDPAATHDGTTRAVLVRGDEITPITLPVNGHGALQATLDADGLAVWDVDLETRDVKALLRARLTGAALTWQRVQAPEGARFAAIASEGRAVVVRSDARVFVSTRMGEFAPLAGAETSPRWLYGDGVAYCAGPWCHLGPDVVLSFAGGPSMTTIGRDDALPASTPARRAAITYECAPSGAFAGAPDMDRGAAFSGYALTASARGPDVSLRWYGATVNAIASLRWSGRVNAPVTAIGAVGETAPGAVLERCAADGCDHAFATATTVTDLALGRALPGGVRLYAMSSGWQVRADAMRDGVPLVTLVSLDGAGRELGRRTFALAEEAPRASVGSSHGRVGMWVRDDGDAMRFYDLDPSVSASGRAVTLSHTPCAEGASVEGVAHLVGDTARPGGRGWEVEADEWTLDETLSITPSGACVASLAGGESRDESEAERARERSGGERDEVRTFALRASGDGTLRGTAWGGHRATPVRCVPRVPSR